MDIQDVLQWTDDQILAKTGKHLDSLQRCTLEQVWQGHTAVPAVMRYSSSN